MPIHLQQTEDHDAIPRLDAVRPLLWRDIADGPERKIHLLLEERLQDRQLFPLILTIAEKRLQTV
jgi:hypothetical protein